MRTADRGGVALSAGAGCLAAAALFASHGSSDGRLFWLGIAAVALAAVGWIVHPPALSGAGVLFLVLFGTFVVWQGITIRWSVEPSQSWTYANRGLVYLAFAMVGALLGDVPRTRIARGFAELTGAVFVVALAAKVIPGLYADYGRIARLRFPLEYWNELALLAAAAVPSALWLTGRRDRRLRARVSGALLLYTAIVTVVLTFSRFGIALTALAVVAWLVVERRELSSLPALVVVVPGAAIAAAVGLALHGVSQDGAPHSTRVRDGLIFGAVLVACAIAVALLARIVLAQEPNVLGLQVLALRGAAVLVLAGTAVLVALVVKSGGPAEFVKDQWHEFATAQSVSSAGRLGSASSGNRWTWWKQAWHSFERHPGGGTGAGTFSLTSTVSAHNSLQTTVEPHNVPLQFLSETGIVGFLLYAGVVAAVVVAIVRGPHDRATTALALALLIALVHSLVDIDWNFVATQGPFFLLAGALVARPAAARARQRAAVVPALATTLCALAALYSLFAPWWANRQLNDAYDAFLAPHPRYSTALSDAKSAHSLNPLAVEPLYLLAELEQDRHFMVDATKREPTNPDTWYLLAAFDFRRGRFCKAWLAANHSYSLDRYGPAGAPGSLLDQARVRLDIPTCLRQAPNGLP